MKILLPVFLVAAALFAQQNPPVAPATQPNPLCGIEGQVTNIATGAPVKKAELVVLRIEPEPQINYSATSDANGKFALQGLEPGKYRLSVSANGFVDASYGARGSNRRGTTLSLDAGELLKDVNPKLTPHGVIAGRIVDEDGDPVVRAEVAARSHRRVEGHKQLMSAGTASTNDLGEYRIFGLAPGRYYVSATYNETQALGSSAKPPEETYVPTYYPAAVDVATAVGVDVPAGAELHAVSIILAKTHTVRVRGHINSPSVGRLTVMILLTPRDQAGGWSVGSQSGADAQGSFEFRGVRPGAYWLETRFFGERPLFVRQPIDVGNTNMDDVAVILAPGVDLQGCVKTEGPAGVNLAAIRILLQAANPTGTYVGPMPNAFTNDDGTFTLPRLAPEHYDFYVSGLPEGYYVKSIRAGDKEVRNSGFGLTSGAAAPLTITIAPGAGQIDGVVIGDKDAVAGALVVLVPDDVQRRERKDAYSTATTGQNGLFTLKNIDPGDYKLYAWADIESEAYMDPDFMKPFESQGLPMSIHESSKETAQLKLIAQ
jgi:hypothetical protein